MFSSLGIVEILIIAGVALVVLGPDKFPQVAKVCIRMFREVRGYWEDAKRDISRELRPVNKEMRELQRYKPEDYIDSLIGDDEDEEDEDETGQDKADDAGDVSPQHDYAEERDNYDGYEQYGLPADDVYNQSGAKTDSAETEATTADDGPDSTEADEDSDSGPEESEPTATDDEGGSLPERLDG